MTVLLRWVILITAGATLWSCSSAPRKTDPVVEKPPTPSKEPPADRAPDTRPVIVAFGDSLTAGLRVDLVNNYPSVLQRKLDAAGYRYRVVNAGVSGDTSAQGLNRLSAVRSYHPAIVILELGANDGLRGIPARPRRAISTASSLSSNTMAARLCCWGCGCRQTLDPSTRRLWRDLP
jgi:acyl-CoA thioesterase-1